MDTETPVAAWVSKRRTGRYPCG